MLGEIPLAKQIIIHQDNYTHLPKRFVDKIDHDLAFIRQADIPHLKGVYLFGSCARGEFGDHSDVDLLIVTEKKLADRMLAAQIRWTLDEEQDGVRTDIIYMNLESIAENTFFKNQVNQDKKILLEVLE